MFSVAWESDLPGSGSVVSIGGRADVAFTVGGRRAKISGGGGQAGGGTERVGDCGAGGNLSPSPLSPVSRQRWAAERRRFVKLDGRAVKLTPKHRRRSRLQPVRPVPPGPLQNKTFRPT